MAKNTMNQNQSSNYTNDCRDAEKNHAQSSTQSRNKNSNKASQSENKFSRNVQEKNSSEY